LEDHGKWINKAISKYNVLALLLKHTNKLNYGDAWLDQEYG